MIKVAFLVNPISGKKGNRLEHKQVRPHLSSDKASYTIKYSSSKKHLEQLTKKCVVDGYNIIVASGGDGTINTVAKFLVGTDIILGILPRGSGNGLASHMGLSDSISGLCKSILLPQVKTIDCGVVNGLYFFSNFALGYPADVIHHYDKDVKRGFVAYLKYSTLCFFKRKVDQITINNSNENKYCVMVSNTKYMGYNVSLTPQAKIDSGVLDVISASSRRNLASRMLRAVIFQKNFASSASELIINTNPSCPAQLDGEPIKTNSPYHINVVKSGLKILI